MWVKGPQQMKQQCKKKTVTVMNVLTDLIIAVAMIAIYPYIKSLLHIP